MDGQGLVAALGFTDTVTSPTYALMNAYPTPAGRVLHVDAYRVRDVQELYEMDLEDLIAGSRLSLIEWGEGLYADYPDAPVLRLVKTSAVREVKVGDLVRYSVLVENVGDSPAVNATLVDIPPAGFTFVDNSLTVDDDNKNGVVISANPLRIGGIDVAIGGKGWLAAGLGRVTPS